MILGHPTPTKVTAHQMLKDLCCFLPRPRVSKMLAGWLKLPNTELRTFLWILHTLAAFKLRNCHFDSWLVFTGGSPGEIFRSRAHWRERLQFHSTRSNCSAREEKPAPFPLFIQRFCFVSGELQDLLPSWPSPLRLLQLCRARRHHTL